MSSDDCGQRKAVWKEKSFTQEKSQLLEGVSDDITSRRAKLFQPCFCTVPPFQIKRSITVFAERVELRMRRTGMEKDTCKRAFNSKVTHRL